MPLISQKKKPQKMATNVKESEDVYFCGNNKSDKCDSEIDLFTDSCEFFRDINSMIRARDIDTDCRHCSVYAKCFAADVEIDNEETTTYYTDVNDYCLEYQSK